MTGAARKVKRKVRKVSARPAAAGPVHKSGEHAISLDAMIRRSFERAFQNDLQSTSRVSRFDLEEILASPEIRPSDAPIVSVGSEGVVIGELPEPAIDALRTKEEERDP